MRATAIAVWDYPWMTSARGGMLTQHQTIVPVGFVSVIVTHRDSNSVYVLWKNLQSLNFIKEDRTSFVYGPIVGWICEKRPSECAAKI